MNEQQDFNAVLKSMIESITNANADYLEMCMRDGAYKLTILIQKEQEDE